MSSRQHGVAGVGGSLGPDLREEEGQGQGIWIPFPAFHTPAAECTRWPDSGVSSMSGISVQMEPRVQFYRHSLKVSVESGDK